MICIMPLMFENMHSILHKNDFSLLFGCYQHVLITDNTCVETSHYPSKTVKLLHFSAKRTSQKPAI